MNLDLDFGQDETGTMVRDSEGKESREKSLFSIYPFINMKAAHDLNTKKYKAPKYLLYNKSTSLCGK